MSLVSACGILFPNPINSVTCVLGTPSESGTTVRIPYTLINHDKNVHYDYIDAWGLIKIEVINTRNSLINTYTKGFSNDMERDVVTGTVTIEITADENYVPGSAELTELTAQDGIYQYLRC